MSALTLPASLAERARAGTLAHAYILRGETPEARRAAAAALAAAMVCQGEAPPCGVCKPCQKAAKGIHPDVITIAPEPGKELTVDQVRRLRQDAYIRPNEAKRKVYILEDTQRMNQSAQNAFLKILEDGPAYAAFLLLTPSPDALLATVRSRCELIRAEASAAERDPELDAKAALVDQSYYRLIRLVNDLAATQYLNGEPLPLRDRDIVEFTADIFSRAASLALS